MKFYATIAAVISLVAITKAAAVEPQIVEKTAAVEPQVAEKFAGHPNCFEIVKNEIYDCGSATDLIHVHEVTFHPKPRPGHKSTMTIIGRTRHGLEKSSKGKLSIKHKHDHVHDEEYDVCDSHDDDHHHGNKVCPREEGKHVKLVKEFHFKAHNHHGEFDLEDVAHSGHHDHHKKVLYHIKARF